MAGRQTADIVFCIDVSTSMDSAIRGVKNNVKALVKSLETDLQNNWDVRVDFVADSALANDSLYLKSCKTQGKELLNEVYHGSLQSSKLFTRDLDEFISAVDSLDTISDEANIPALDIASDFPFRDASTCHRAIILMTDETVKGGELVSESEKRLQLLAEKLQNKKIALYLITPQCESYEFLSQIDKCEWTIVDDFDELDFTKLLQTIGKSISVSQTNGASKRDDRPRPLFNETAWQQDPRVPGSLISASVRTLITESIQ